jgi:hypothetical protein
MFDNLKFKNDLKIVVDNTNQAGGNKEEENEILELESGDLVEDMDHNNNNSCLNKQQSNDIHAVEMISEADETEFHVNLDKVPLSLKNTVLGSKLYINDSYEKVDKIDDIVRLLLFYNILPFNNKIIILF